jgi:predicted transposase YbfD/YdcC
MSLNEENFTSSLLHYFSTLEDSRVAGRCRHNLIDIIVITICAYLSEMNTWEDIEFYGNSKIEWLSNFLELPNGIPSHDTFSRVFSLIDGKEFEKVFFDWAKSIKELKKDQVIAFDGKTVNGTAPVWSALKKTRPLALVNIWATKDEMVLGQVLSKNTGNSELESILEALDLIDLEKMIVTVDAASARSILTKKVIEKKGDYVIPCKNNQKVMARKLKTIFENDDIKRTTDEIVTKRKDRTEKRICTMINVTDVPYVFNEKDGEPLFYGAKNIAYLKYIREEDEIGNVRIRKNENNIFEKELIKKGKKISTYERFIVTSLEVSPDELIDLVRQHWGIENGLHWRLDVILGEDDCRIRNKKLAANVALIRKICLNLLMKHKEKKLTLKRLVKMFIWQDEFREKVLFS